MYGCKIHASIHAFKQRTHMYFDTHHRGTLEVGDVLSDVSAHPVRMRAGDAEGWAHDGFFKSAQHVLEAVQPALRDAAERFPGRPLLITGHSLGGMMGAHRMCFLTDAVCSMLACVIHAYGKHVPTMKHWQLSTTCTLYATTHLDHVQPASRPCCRSCCKTPRQATRHWGRCTASPSALLPA